MRQRRSLALVVFAVAVTACATTDPSVRTRGAETLAPETTVAEIPFETVPDDPEPPVDTTVPTEPESTIPDAGGPVFTLPEGKNPQPYDDYLEAVINDIQNFWRNEYPAVYGTPYSELENGVHPMQPGDVVTPGCGEPSTDYAAVEDNAFYCSLGDFIAYDDSALIPQLVEQLGEISVGVVLAHEWGHAIQTRAGYEDATIYMEQQADCFAGAWIAHVARGESTEISFSDSDLRSTLNAMIFVRDQPGTEAIDPLAHGSAFDRVGAFEDGFKNGAGQCAGYPENKPTILQFGYDPSDPDIAAQENAPLEDPSGQGGDIFSLAVSELNKFWPQVVSGMPTIDLAYYSGEPVSACDPEPPYIFSVAFFCPSTGAVAVEQDNIVQIYNQPELGDFGVIYVLATGWSEAAMDTMGASLEGEQRALAADCFVGSFARSVLPEEFNGIPLDNRAVLSPGDLDEAVSTAIAAGDDSEDTDANGSPFEKIDAFRLGVLGDVAACQERFGF